MNRLPLSSLLNASLHSLFSPHKQLESVRTFMSTPQTHDILVLARGQEALHAAFLDWDIQDCEIILPSHLCADVFVPLCIQHGLTPRLVDCAPGTYAPSLRAIMDSITPRTKAIVVVYAYGISFDIRALYTLCDKKNIILIEDCAHALAHTSNRKWLGSRGHGAIYSFVKEVPCFGGGVYVNNVRAIRSEVMSSVRSSQFTLRDLKLLLHKLRWVPRFSFQNMRKSPPPVSSSLVVSLHHMSSLTTSLFLALIQRRNFSQIKKQGLRALQHLTSRGITCMSPQDYASGSGKCIAFCVQDKEGVLAHLREAGFYPGKGWVPSMVSHPLARRWKGKRMPVTERYEQELITLDADELIDEERYLAFEQLF